MHEEYFAKHINRAWRLTIDGDHAIITARDGTAVKVRITDVDREYIIDCDHDCDALLNRHARRQR